MYTMLVKSRSRQGQRNVFLIVALLLFVFATLDVALLLRHVLDAFVWYHGSDGARGEFSDISYWVNVMKTVNYVAQTSIGDGMLVSNHPPSGDETGINAHHQHRYIDATLCTPAAGRLRPPSASFGLQA